MIALLACLTICMSKSNNRSRRDYRGSLIADLKLALDAGLPEDVIGDLQDRLASLSEYKAAWHKAHYVPTGRTRGRPRKIQPEGNNE